MTVRCILDGNFVKAVTVLCIVFLLSTQQICVKSKTTKPATYLHCPTECSCLGNVVDCSKRTLMTVPENLPNWVETLDLCSNSIKSLGVDAFDGLERLGEINLGANPLVQFNCTVFHKLPKLTNLKLDHCHLQELPRCELSALNISHLTVNHNNIAVINPEFLKAVMELQSLDIGYNMVMHLNGDTFPLMPKLHYLFLNNNQLQFIDQGVFDNLISLEWLKLNKNKIEALPKNVFFRLGHLKYLELERNRIRYITGLLFQGLDSLLSLKLKRNVITELMDGAFWGLNRIQILDLSHNNISTVNNKWLYGLESLVHLSLAHNQISEILDDCWRFCQRLVQLDLSHNRLISLSDKTFEKLESLRQLYISHNQLSFISDGSFSFLTTLHVLDLSYNEISWTAEDKGSLFRQLISLSRLTLRHNFMKAISKQTFQGLGKLRQLNLVDNNITSIQAGAFDDMTEMNEFHLNSSHMICNCQLSWLKRWLSKTGFHSTVVVQCGFPESLREINIFDLEITDFKCVDFPKPIITHEPESKVAIKFGNVSLTCQAATSVNSPLSIEWKKDNVAVTDATVVTNMSGSTSDDVIHVTSSLTIWPVLDVHAGNYQCVASNKLGISFSGKAVVTVSVFPVFIKTPSNIVVKSGTTARLDCAATGFPQPEISLQKDGGDDFPAARERRMHIFPSDEMFFIVDIKSEDQGIYTCIAKNNVGVITANASLQVLEAPSFVKRMENKVTVNGETTVLECMTSGSPKPRLEWLKDGIPLQTTLRHFFTADDQLLIIVQTQASDAGEYTCIMTNTLGSERQKSRLMVRLHDGDINRASQEESTTTGIIIIAVVCCIVGTSLIWVIVIYKTRQRHKRYQDDDDDDGNGKRLSSTFRGRVCHEESVAYSSVKGIYCPIQSSAFGSIERNGMAKCPQYKHHLTNVFPVDTEEEGEEEADGGGRFTYHVPHRNIRLPDDEQVHRHRSDSGTHTASSSLSSSTNNSHSISEPLQTFQPFEYIRGPPCVLSEKLDAHRNLAIVHHSEPYKPSYHLMSTNHSTTAVTHDAALKTGELVGHHKQMFSSFLSKDSADDCIAQQNLSLPSAFCCTGNSEELKMTDPPAKNDPHFVNDSTGLCTNCTLNNVSFPKEPVADGSNLKSPGVCSNDCSDLHPIPCIDIQTSS